MTYLKHGQPVAASPVRLREAARRGARLAGAVLLAGGLAACSSAAIVTKHGHHFQPSELQQVQPGMTQEQIRMALGTPTATSSVGTGDAFYYISSTTKQVAFLAPEEVDRRVVAVYFSRSGMVERIAEYGIQDGKVFDFISRTTPTSGAEVSYLTPLFRLIGGSR